MVCAHPSANVEGFRVEVSAIKFIKRTNAPSVPSHQRYRYATSLLCIYLLCVWKEFQFAGRTCKDTLTHIGSHSAPRRKLPHTIVNRVPSRTMNTSETQFFACAVGPRRQHIAPGTFSATFRKHVSLTRRHITASRKAMGIIARHIGLGWDKRVILDSPFYTTSANLLDLQASPEKCELTVNGLYTARARKMVPLACVMSRRRSPIRANRVLLPAGIGPEFSRVRILPCDAADRRVFSGSSRFPISLSLSLSRIPALLHPSLASPSSALETSMLTVVQISALHIFRSERKPVRRKARSQRLRSRVECALSHPFTRALVPRTGVPRFCPLALGSLCASEKREAGMRPAMTHLRFIPSSANWSLRRVFIGCCPTPGSYGIRKVFSCKSAIGSEASRAGLINCDPIAKDIKQRLAVLNGHLMNELMLLYCKSSKFEDGFHFVAACTGSVKTQQFLGNKKSRAREFSLAAQVLRRSCNGSHSTHARATGVLMPLTGVATPSDIAKYTPLPPSGSASASNRGDSLNIHGDSSPFLLQPFHELSNGFWPRLTSPHPAIQFFPNVFYRAEVGALGGPVQSANIVVGVPLHNSPRNMAPGIVILEVTRVHSVKSPQCWEHFIIQNVTIGLCVHASTDKHQRSYDEGHLDVENPPNLSTPLHFSCTPRVTLQTIRNKSVTKCYLRLQNVPYGLRCQHASNLPGPDWRTDHVVG
ncbi:hypothetical protein PR048_003475 [Dryococelus australis]|uniref:Uncharacterized protein n=1 Tax=Dryococelus australis TaxID=614101 RepID=A0ABQ9IN35_9NEOP|nr:hypothetical protein PR048_003475 [Dryococelus australis]